MAAKSRLVVLLVGASLPLAALGQPAPKVGLKVGDVVPALHAVAVNGPYRGQRVCYTTTYQGAPTVYAFVNDRGAVPAVVELDRTLQQHAAKGLKGVIVAVTGPDAAGQLKALVLLHRIKTPVCYLEKGDNDPDLPAWKLPSQAKGMALVVAARKKVVATFVNPPKEAKARVEAAITKALQQAPPAGK